MKEIRHKVLCVDDEPFILKSLKRLLRNEEYDLLTTSSGKEGLEILENNEVHLVIADLRMPEMNGIHFLAEAKDRYPEVIRVILTGYTEVRSITESINRGHIYKFFLKPWNDENLKLEIWKALDQYDLIQVNKNLPPTIMAQKEQLIIKNDELETKVILKTEEFEYKNESLILPQTVFDNIPFSIIGASTEGNIVFINNLVNSLPLKNGSISIGEKIDDCFSERVVNLCRRVIDTDETRTISEYMISGEPYSIIISPFSGNYKGVGIILTIISCRLMY